MPKPGGKRPKGANAAAKRDRMHDHTLDGLSVVELKALWARVEKAIEVRLPIERREMRDRIREMVEAEGMTVEEVIGKPKPRKRPVDRSTRLTRHRRAGDVLH